MAATLFEASGVTVTAFQHAFGPRVELWSNGAHLTPDEAASLASDLAAWAFEQKRRPALAVVEREAP